MLQKIRFVKFLFYLIRNVLYLFLSTIIVEQNIKFLAIFFGFWRHNNRTCIVYISNDALGFIVTNIAEKKVFGVYFEQHAPNLPS